MKLPTIPPQVADLLGVRVVRVYAQDENSWTFDLAMPRQGVRFTIDRDAYILGREVLVRELDCAARQLFAQAIDHIAKHDRHPLDRMKLLESTAAATLPRDELDDSGAQRDLRRMLMAKPGSPSWSRHGYGDEKK